MTMFSTVSRTAASTSPRDVLWPVLWGIVVTALLPLVGPLQVSAEKPAVKEGRIYFWRDKRVASVQPDGKDLKWHSSVMKNAGGFPNVFLGHPRVSPNGQAVAFPMAGYSVKFGNGTGEKTTDHEWKTRILTLDKEEPMINLGWHAQEWTWSADGSKLAFSLVDCSNWLFDLKTKKKTALKLPEGHSLTDWSRDGAWLLTHSMTKTGPIVSLVKQDGSDARALTEPELQATRARFSPDGRMILFHGTDPKGKSKHIYAMDLKEKKPWKVSQELNGFVSGGCWSPDSKRIAYIWGQTSDQKVPGVPEQLFRETETFLIVADADGKNSATLFSEKKPVIHVTLWSVDWR
jgi:Tol biopolymer transport system component